MKDMPNCPFCNEPLLNEMRLYPRADIILKSCWRKINHKIGIRINEKTDKVELLMINIDMQNHIVFYWDFVTVKCQISKNSNDKTIWQDVPFFEPDLSDYKKLLSKVKTYVIFS